MTTFDDAVKAIRAHDADFQAALKSWPAYLGDGEGNVSGSQLNYYHCRYPTSESPAVEVYANDCPPVDGLKVTVGYSADQPELIKVLSWSDPNFDNTTTPLKYHADQHAYLAGDTTWVDWRQITALKVQPYGGLTLYVNGGVLPRSGVDTLVIPQVVNLTGHTPASSGLSRYCLISLDTSGVVTVTDGSDVASLSLDISDVPETPTGNLRLAAVALAYGQTTIEESITRTDILDLRWPQEYMAGSPYAIFGAQTANTVLSGPTTGAAAVPTFRALVTADIPAHDIAGALHTTSGRTAGQVLQATGAAAFGWSTNTLTIAGNSTINGSLVGNITGGGTLATNGFTLTVPKTGTAAVGTGTAGRIAEWVTDVNTLQASTLAKSGAGVLTLSAASDFTLTVPDTGTAAIGTGAANRIAYWSGANTLTSNATLTFDGTNAGIGTAPNATDRLYVLFSTTATSGTIGAGRFVSSSSPATDTSATVRGGFFYVTAAASAINYTGSIQGLFGQAQNFATGTLTRCDGLNFASSNNSTGTITTLTGQSVGATNAAGGNIGTAYGSIISTSNTGAGTITTGVGERVGVSKTAGTITTAIGFWLEAITAGTTNYALYSLGGQSYHAGNFGLGNNGTPFAAASLIHASLNNATTATVDTITTLTHNTTGTAAAGFGGSIALNLESSTTADQAAAEIDWLWTDATHASRTALYRGKTTGNATNTGYYGHWNHSAVAGSAITVIPNATGDVTEIATFVYAVAEVTGTGTSGGTVTVTPGGGAVTLYSDGTDTLQLTCVADGSVTVQRSAGTDTFKVSLWGTWL